MRPALALMCAGLLAACASVGCPNDDRESGIGGTGRCEQGDMVVPPTAVANSGSAAQQTKAFAST
jgi:hypothetical protein